jgi:hypothetical protein
MPVNAVVLQRNLARAAFQKLSRMQIKTEQKLIREDFDKIFADYPVGVSFLQHTQKQVNQNPKDYLLSCRVFNVFQHA